MLAVGVVSSLNPEHLDLLIFIVAHQPAQVIDLVLLVATLRKESDDAKAIGFAEGLYIRRHNMLLHLKVLVHYLGVYLCWCRSRGQRRCIYDLS